MPDTTYGVYVHIPFCRSKCAYCGFVSVSDFTLRHSYMQALVGEIESCRISGAAVDTIYIGGGTPSCLSDGEIARIIDAVRMTFVVSRDAEITVECNPESADDRFIAECRAVGVNRISVGMQSSSDKVLKNIGRIHSARDYISAVERLCDAFDNISSDIILGLPEQQNDDIARSIDIAAQYCSHVSIYGLSVENGTPLAASGYIADDEAIADMYDIAYKRLCDCGYSRYEVSNFARGGKVCRHNVKYWNGSPYIGFGVAAHGYDGNNIRYSHSDDLFEYIKSPRAAECALTQKDVYNEYIMLRLRTENGIDARDFANRFGYTFAERWGKKLEQRGLSNAVIITPDSIKIAPQYMFVMNGIITELMLD